LHKPIQNNNSKRRGVIYEIVGVGEGGKQLFNQKEAIK